MDVPCEGLQYAGHVLHPIPAGNLYDDWNCRMGRRSAAHDVGFLAHAPIRIRGVASDEPRRREDPQHLMRPEFLVLGGEGIDRGWYRPQARSIDPLRRERLAREHMRIRRLDVGSQERPGTVRPLVCSVEAHVTTPDDVGALFDERENEARRLRVVDDHHVVLPNLATDGLEVPGERALVDRALSSFELASVTGRAIEAVVDSLRHREELGIAVENQPVRLEPDAAHVAE